MKLIFCVILLFGAATAFNDRRLPNETKPLIYLMKFTIYTDKNDGDKRWTFDGESLISLTATSRKSCITNIQLHADDSLNFSLVTVMPKTYALKDQLCFTRDEDFMNIKLDKCWNGKTRLYLKFRFRGAILHQDGKRHGMFWSKYGDNHDMVATFFEPTGARKVFPCFDEPRFKTPFKIQVTARKRYTVLNNARAASSKHRAKNKKFAVTKFETTVPLSTYVVTLALFEYRRLCKDESTTLPICFHYSPEIIDDKRASQIVNETYNYFYQLQKLLKVPYPMTKLDSVVVPNFQFGMENPGLVLYGPTLLQPYIIAHEMAHQWFGNILTVGWWTDIWLHEGFATFFQYLFEGFEINWKTEQFANLVLKTLTGDHSTYGNYKPLILSDVSEYSSSFEAYFGTSIYNKGATIVIQMLEILGQKSFIRVLHKCLEKFSTMPATTFGLMEILTEEAEMNNITGVGGEPLNFNKYLHKYLTEKNYPVLRIEFNKDKYAIHIQQAPKNFASGITDDPWIVFIKLTLYPGKLTQVLWMEKEIWFPIPEKVTKIVIDENGFGFYGYYENSFDIPKLLNSSDQEKGRSSVKVLNDKQAGPHQFKKFNQPQRDLLELNLSRKF